MKIFFDLVLPPSSSRNYIPCIYLLNKIDQISIEELEIITKVLSFGMILIFQSSVIVRFPIVYRSLRITNGTTTACLRRCGIISSWYKCNDLDDLDNS